MCIVLPAVSKVVLLMVAQLVAWLLHHLQIQILRTLFDSTQVVNTNGVPIAYGTNLTKYVLTQYQGQT